MPEENDPEVMELETVGSEDGKSELAANLLYWAPPAFFALSLVVGLVTYIFNPTQTKERRKAPEEYFIPAQHALALVQKPKKMLSRIERINKLNEARINLKRLIKHYRNAPDFMSGKYRNPYVLLAESNRTLAELVMAERKKELLKSAIVNYTRGMLLEKRPRSAIEQTEWLEQFKVEVNETTDEALQRQIRRKRYIVYYKALLEFKIGNYNRAEEGLEGLRKIFFREEMQRLRLERDGKDSSGQRLDYVPGDYELLPENKIKLHFNLAKIYAAAGALEKAEKEFKFFLLKAPRGYERFQAKMQLGKMAYKRGRKLSQKAERVGGERRNELVNKAVKKFKRAADIYEGIVAQSAPENILRKAYFQGGIANLALASSMNVGKESAWDFVAHEGQVLARYLEGFSGMKLPNRALSLPGSIGKSLIADAVEIPGSFAFVGRLALGSGLVLATRKRITPKEERNKYLAKARSFFDAAGSGPTGELLAESRIMIGRSLLIEQRPDEARRILDHAMKVYPYAHIRVAALLGIGKTYLFENKLDLAWKFYSRLPKQDEMPKTNLFDQQDITYDLRLLAEALVRKADSLAYPVSWLDAPPGSRKLADAMRRSKNLQRVVAQALTVYEVLVERYNARDVVISVSIAALYARWGELLEKPPYGRQRELLRARELKMLAADKYARVAVELPGSSFDEDVLLRAGELFFASNAYERAAETSEIFTKRHGRSEQIGKVRNQLGLAYQKLGLYKQAAQVLRINAQDSSTAEGRKALFYLGDTYMQWADVEKDKVHLGGSSSPLLMTQLDVEKQKKRSLLKLRDIADWQGLLTKLKTGGEAVGSSVDKRLFEALNEKFRESLSVLDYRNKLTDEFKQSLLSQINQFLIRRDFYIESLWLGKRLGDEVEEFLKRGTSELGLGEIVRLNRLLVEAAYPGQIVKSPGKEMKDTIPHTAREVFAYVRRLSGIGPESRPWRWSTFALGEVLYRIAEFESEKYTRKLSSGSAADDKTRGRTSEDLLRNYYVKAAEVLNEAINRYALFPENKLGIRAEQDPYGYIEIKRSRFKALYRLSLCYKFMGDDKRLQQRLRELLDNRRYSPELLGTDMILQRIYRNSHFLLGLSLYKTGDYNASYEVFENAYDSLKTSEGPYFIYMMGECLRATGRYREARSKYIQAQHAVRTAGKAELGSFPEFGVGFWQKQNEKRIADLEYLAQAEGISTK